MSDTVETHLCELGFALPVEGNMEQYLAAPTPVELEDSKGNSWAVYRHLDFPKDLQLWVSNDLEGKIRFRRLGRLRDTSYEFESFSMRKISGKLRQAITELSDLPEMN